VSSDATLSESEWSVLDLLLIRSYYEDEVGLYAWGHMNEAAFGDAQGAMISLVRRGFVEIYEAWWERGCLGTGGPLPIDEALARVAQREAWGTGNQAEDLQKPHLRVLTTERGRNAFPPFRDIAKPS
jgi:hypothetical protein